jgi:GNAT superfamily N-acetyltransferase
MSFGRCCLVPPDECARLIADTRFTWKLTAINTRLAVDHQHQGKGLGKALLKDALMRTAQAADIAGIRCLLVHAKDEAARQWYESWEFEPSPTDPYHLFLLIKDLKELLAG